MSSLDPRIRALADRFWDLHMAHEPTWANLVGDHRFDDQIEDISAEAEAAFGAQLRDVIAKASEVDGVDRRSRIVRDLLVHEAESALVDIDGRTQEFLIDPQIGFHVQLSSFTPQLSAQTREQADALVERTRKTGNVYDQAIDRLRTGLAGGRTPVQALVAKSLDQLDRYLESDLAADPFTRPQAPPSFSEAEEQEWRDALRTEVEHFVRPAATRYRDFVRNEALPVARGDDEVGIRFVPGGDELYAAAVKKYTSLDADPEEIHDIGLETMAGLAEEYRELGARVLGTADLQEIYDHLRNDTDLRYSSADEVLEAARKAVDRAEAEAPNWFGTMPSHSCGVTPIPSLEAAEAPLAYYLPPAEDGSRPGTFFINSAHPERITRYEMEALAFHEGVPGHHFQTALAQDDRSIPAFIRNALIYAHAEGWGLYTERLADEMGLYSGDLQRMGMLSFDSWRAGRLVVDTGMHVKGWSRQRAVDYLVENSPQQIGNIETEIDRYIGYFAQALSYMMGRREMMRLRSHAKEQLGPSFDIKGFHDVVIGSGPVTLPILAELVEEWVSGQG